MQSGALIQQDHTDGMGCESSVFNDANGEAIKIDGAGVWESSDIFLVIASFLLCVVFVSKTLK